MPSYLYEYVYMAFNRCLMSAVVLFQIIGSRLGFEYTRDGIMWNWPPGALVSLPSFSDTLKHFPFYTHMLGIPPGNSLTAVIYVTRGGVLTTTNPLYKLVRNISKSQFVVRVSEFKSLIAYLGDGLTFVNWIFFDKGDFNLSFQRSNIRIIVQSA